MFVSRGKAVVDCLKQGCGSVRYFSVPQSFQTSESSPVAQEKPKKEPFMKNVLVGKVEDDFLQFSSCKSEKLPDHLSNFIAEVKKSESSMNAYKKLTLYAKNGFFKFSTPESLDGIKTSMTDLLHFYEQLDLDPATATLLETHSSHIIPILLKHGSPEQKKTFLKKVLEGEITGSYALLERNGFLDPTGISTTATEDKGGLYSISGEKSWITNALNADFYIVLTKLPIPNLKKHDATCLEEVTAFLLKKGDNISVQQQSLLGLSECGISSLKLTDYPASDSDMIGPSNMGFVIAAEGFKSPHLISMACLLNNLKKLIRDVISHVNSIKLVPKDLKETELVKDKLMGVLITAYSLETMMYYITDINDRYDLDSTLESALVQIYGYENGLQAMQTCLEMMGQKSWDKDYPYEKLWRDFKTLSSFNSNDVLRLYASLIGVEYAGNYMQDTIKKTRNPFNFPTFVFKKTIENNQFIKNKVKLSLKLYMNFHPTLKDAADELERCILQLKFAIEMLLTRHGPETVHRQIDLNRILDAALEVFVMATCLTRASHSYCTGVQHSEQELLIAQKVCIEGRKKVKELLDYVTFIDSTVNDSRSVDLGAHFLSQKSYFIEHPLKHDI